MDGGPGRLLLRTGPRVLRDVRQVSEFVDCVFGDVHELTERERARKRERERERERERALLGTTVHNGGSRASPAPRTPHHHARPCFPTHNERVASYMAKTFPGR